MRVLPVGELHPHVLSSALLEPTVEGEHVCAEVLQEVLQVVAVGAGLTEHQRRPGIVLGQNRRDHLEAQLSCAVHHFLPQCGRGQLRVDGDVDRVGLDGGAQIVDAVGEGCREEQGLPPLRTAPHNGDHCVVEAHVEHAVGFVEHQGRGCREVEVAALEVVLHSAGRADHNVGSLLQGSLLGSQGMAAAQGYHAGVGQALGQGTHGCGHLFDQLSGGGKDERAGRAGGTSRGLAALGEGLEDAEAEGGGLSAASLGLGGDIAACENLGQGLRLDGGGRAVAQAARGLLECGMEKEGGEWGHGGA